MRWLLHMLRLISGQGWAGADGKEERTANKNSCHISLSNLMFWDQLGSVAQLGSPWHISMLWKHPIQKLLMLPEEREAGQDETWTTLLVWTQDSQMCSLPHIKWLPSLEQWWRHCAVQGSVFDNWTCQEVCQTEQFSCVTEIIEQHRMMGPAILKKVVYSRQIPRDHRIIAVSLLPVLYCPISVFSQYSQCVKSGISYLYSGNWLDYKPIDLWFLVWK